MLFFSWIITWHNRVCHPGYTISVVFKPDTLKTLDSVVKPDTLKTLDSVVKPDTLKTLDSVVFTHWFVS